MTQSMIKVEVAYALADQQKIIALEVAEGCTALEAAQLSKIDSVFVGLDLEGAKMGVFGGCNVTAYRSVQVLYCLM